MAAAVLLGSALSASAYEYSATPASGSTVEMLSKIVVHTDTGWDGLADSWDMDNEAVTVTKDGVSVSTVQFSNDWMEYSDLIIELDTPATEAGDYVVTIPAGTIITLDGSVWQETDIVLNYTVEPVVGVTYDVMPTSVYPADGSDMDISAGMSNVMLNVADEYTAISGAKATFANVSAGYSEEVNMRKFNAGMLFVYLNELTNIPTQNGEYTLTIPAGMIGSETFVASNGEAGYANPELVYHYNVTGAETGVAGDAQITSVMYVPTDGSSVELTEGLTLASLVNDAKIEFNTTDNLAVGYIRAELLDKNALNPDDAMRVFESRARRTLPENRGVFWQDDEVPFLRLAREEVLQEGHSYEFTAVLYDFETPPYSRTELCTYHVVINGSTPGYEYSNVKYLGVTPDPNTFEIFNETQATITLTFDGWVEVDMARSGNSYGQMGFNPISAADVAYNDDHTQIYYTFPASELASATGSVSVSLYVVDSEGRAVYTGNDNKEDSYFNFVYACFAGSPDLLITPETGVVTEIKDIEISCPTGPAGGMINLSYASSSNIKVTDLSGDKVFAEFTATPVVVESGSNEDGSFPKKYRFSLDQAITNPGVYVVNVPSMYFALGSQYDAATSKQQFVTYTIEGEPVSNVIYDMIPYVNDMVVNRDANEAITGVKMTLEFDYEYGDVDYAKLEEIQLKNDETGEAVDAKFDLAYDWDEAYIAYLTITAALEENVPYTLIMPQGTYGDIDWADSNYEEGHSNPALSLPVVVEAPLAPVEFDLELSTKVELSETDGKFTKATVTFTAEEEEYIAYDDMALEDAVLLDAEGKEVDAMITPGILPGAYNSVKLVVTYDFEANTKYTLVVAEGTFGDEEWEYEDFMTGHANAPIMVEIDTTQSGVENVLAGDDVKVDVYNLQGVMLVKDADAAAIKALPAGLYIIGGQKVAVK